MQLQSKHNGGVVVVDEAFGKQLLDGGGFVPYVPAPEPKHAKRAPKTKPAPAGEQTPEE